jgi:hypothetical protein
MPESSSASSDWFTDLVAQACAAVTATAEVQASLAVLDRVTAASIMDEIIGSADKIADLRAQFPSEVATGESIAALRAVRDAYFRVEAAEADLEMARHSDRERLSYRGTYGTVPLLRVADRAPEAKDKLAQAKAALDAARARVGLQEETVLPAEGTLDGRAVVLRLELEKPLLASLTIMVNAIIDRELAASYDREFSYQGSARLADLLDHATTELGSEVNRDAVRVIQDLIDSDFTGAVGVAGPRGIGKSTLLARFTRNSVGVCVAAPAQYDARDFLLHLFGQLCVSVLGADEARKLEDGAFGGAAEGEPTGFPYAWLGACLSAAALLCGAVVIGLDTARPVRSQQAMADLLIAGCCAVIAVLIAVVPASRFRAWQRWWIAGRYRLTDDPQHRVTSYDERLFDSVAGKAGRSLQRWRWASLVGAAPALALAALVTAGGSLNPGYLAAAGLAVAASGLLAVLSIRRDFEIRRALYSARLAVQLDAARLPDQLAYWRDVTYRRSPARYWYKRVKFQQTYTSGWSGSVTMAPSILPVQAQFGRSGSTDITSAAMSIPEIVAAFHAFTAGLRVPPQNLGLDERDRDPTARPIPVVIGIDEVDKIEDPQQAQAFFNQIKGLFGDTPCLFLISISDDALAAYERRGLPLRDAFDSSLSRVVSLSYLSRQDARALIGSRLVQVTNPSADLLYVLSGGLPRELVRLIRRAVEIQREHADTASAVGTSASAAAPPKREASDDGAISGTTPVTVLSPGSGDKGDGQAGRKPAPVPLDAFAAELIAEQVAAQRRAVLIRGRSFESCAATGTLLTWASGQADDGEAVQSPGSDPGAVTAYLDRLLHVGTDLLRSCDRTNPAIPELGAPPFQPHTTDCAARETGAFLAWLATVGQVFGQCETREDFEAGERPNGSYSFEWLARARQNFALGPDYVTTALAKVRKAWGLPEITRL